jgi:hypothetical protein
MVSFTVSGPMGCLMVAYYKRFVLSSDSGDIGLVSGNGVMNLPRPGRFCPFEQLVMAHGYIGIFQLDVAPLYLGSSVFGGT